MIPVIDKIKPLGSFAIADAADIEVTEGKRLTEVLSDKANASDVNALASDKADKSYVDGQLATKATTASVNAKLDKSVFDSAFTFID